MMYGPSYYTYDADTWCEDCLPVSPDEEEVGAGFPDYESDAPNHCAGCGMLLDHALTPDGYAYVEDAVREYNATGYGAVVRDWWDQWHYGDDDMPPLLGVLGDARRLASEWHAGQWSALYAFASSGHLVERADIVRELAECESPETDALAEWIATRVGRFLVAVTP